MTSRDLQGFCAAIALNNDPRGGGALFVAGGKFTRGFARQKNFYNAFLTWAYGKLRWIRNARLLCVRVSQFFPQVVVLMSGHWMGNRQKTEWGWNLCWGHLRKLFLACHGRSGRCLVQSKPTRARHLVGETGPERPSNLVNQGGYLPLPVWVRNQSMVALVWSWARIRLFFAGVGPVGAGGIGSIGDWAFGEFHRFEHPAPKNFVSRQIGVVCATGFVTKSDSRVGGQCVANPRSITRGHQFYVKQEVGYES